MQPGPFHGLASKSALPPANLIKSFNLDLPAADTPKQDERGRTVELHALPFDGLTALARTAVG